MRAGKWRAFILITQPLLHLTTLVLVAWWGGVGGPIIFNRMALWDSILQWRLLAYTADRRSTLLWMGVLRFVDVCRIEEVGKEKKVTEVHSKRNIYIKIRSLHSTVTVPLRIRGHVPVHVYIHIDTNNHLQELKWRYEYVYPHWRAVESRCTHSIIKVHNGMHKVVHGNEPLSRHDYVAKVIPAVHEDSYVMIPVKKYQLLLP